MPTSSPATEALVCPGPLLTGLRVWHCLEPQDAPRLHLPRARGLRPSRTSMSQRGSRQEQWRVNFCTIESNGQTLRKSALALGCEMVSGRVKAELICLFLNRCRGQSLRCYIRDAVLRLPPFEAQVLRHSHLPLPGIPGPQLRQARNIFSTLLGSQLNLTN